jgi:RNA polymerase sigma-70 factor (ECF subfamily)
MEDAQIVDLYWQRSEEALTETERKYGRLCRSVARNILENDQDAEEMVNDTWLAAWNSMPVNRPHALGAYLAKITRNFSISRALERSRRKRGGGELPLALDELAECVAGPEDPELAAETHELTRRIDAFLRTLPAVERQIFVSRYWYMAGMDEIAERFGFTRSKTSGILFRTRKKLHSMLRKENLL